MTDHSQPQTDTPIGDVGAGAADSGKLRRFGQLRAIARRHGLLPLRALDFSTDPATGDLRAHQAESLRRALEEAGGAFVKLGQMLSTRDDVLPREWRDALSHLHKNVEPARWSEVRALVESELEVSLEDAFVDFDAEPVASASIAQVHRARLASGDEVAVKVRRPNIVGLIERDVDIAVRASRLLAGLNARVRRLGFEQIVHQYGDDLLRQTDFRLEATNLAALSATQPHQRHSGVRLPRLHAALSTHAVLVMEFVSGPTLSACTASTHDGSARYTELLRTVLRSFLGQVIFHGVYHSDLHPGNIIVDDEGRPTLVDFGSVGRLPRELRVTVQDLLLAYLNDDTQRIGDAVLSMSPLADSRDEDAFRHDLSRFVTYQLGAGARLGLATVDAAVDLFSRYGMSMPPEFVNAARSFTVLEGTIRSLDAGFDVLQESKDSAWNLATSQASRSGLRRILSTEVLALLPGLRRLPRRVDQIGAQLESGRLNINLRFLADSRDRQLLMSFVREGLLTLIGIAAGLSGLLLLTASPADPPGALSRTSAGLILCSVSVASFVGVVIDVILTRRRG